MTLAGLLLLVTGIGHPGAPPEGEQLVREAMRILHRVSGFTFRWGGSTGHRPKDLLEHGPIEVTWTTQSEVPEMTSDVAGRAGSQSVRTSGQRWWYSTGLVMLSQEYFARMSRIGDHDAMLATVLHEFGPIRTAGQHSRPARKFRTSSSPWRDRIDSGWNWTPTSGRSGWRTAITTPLCSSTAVCRSTGPRSTAASEW